MIPSVWEACYRICKCMLAADRFRDMEYMQDEGYETKVARMRGLYLNSEDVADTASNLIRVGLHHEAVRIFKAWTFKIVLRETNPNCVWRGLDALSVALICGYVEEEGPRNKWVDELELVCAHLPPKITLF